MSKSVEAIMVCLMHVNKFVQWLRLQCHSKISLQSYVSRWRLCFACQSDQTLNGQLFVIDVLNKPVKTKVQDGEPQGLRTRPGRTCSGTTPNKSNVYTKIRNRRPKSWQATFFQWCTVRPIASVFELIDGTDKVIKLKPRCEVWLTCLLCAALTFIWIMFRQSRMRQVSQVH